MSTRRVRVHVPSMLDDTSVRRVSRPKRRFLFVVPPLTGHVNPNVAVAAELAERGHKVAWAGHRAALEPLLPSGSRIHGTLDRDFAARLPALQDAWLGLRGHATVRFLWEEFAVPLGHAMMPGVLTAVDRFRPDAVVCDQITLAGPVAARLREIPWASSVAACTEVARPLAGTPKVERWVRDRIDGFQRAHGIEDALDLRFSDHLVLVFTTAALMGDVSEFPEHYAFVGPALGRPAGSTFPWEWLDGRPAVLVTLGTLNGPSGERFYRVAADAVRGMDVQAILVAPPALAARAGLGDPPPNVLVRHHVPQLDLLPRLSAVVCHGGHTTVCETLANGLPLVVAPIRDDQPIVARQVEAAGAGIAVRFSRVRAEELAAALTTVLADGPHRAAARRVRDSFAAAGGAAEAADRLEKLT